MFIKYNVEIKFKTRIDALWFIEKVTLTSNNATLLLLTTSLNHTFSILQPLNPFIPRLAK